MIERERVHWWRNVEGEVYQNIVVHIPEHLQGNSRRYQATWKQKFTLDDSELRKGLHVFLALAGSLGWFNVVWCLPGVLVMTAKVTEKSRRLKFRRRDLNRFWRFTVAHHMIGQCDYRYIVQRFIYTKLWKNVFFLRPAFQLLHTGDLGNA